MNALRKAFCSMGHHSGPWSPPGKHCEIARVCESCGTTEEQTDHLWGPWFYVNNELNSPQVHTCKRCRETERTRYTLR